MLGNLIRTHPYDLIYIDLKEIQSLHDNVETVGIVMKVDSGNYI